MKINANKLYIKVLICVILCFSIINTVVFANENNNNLSKMPSVSAESYIVIEAESGRIIASKNAEEKKYMASTTKIMTAILAIEEYGDLNKTVSIPSQCTNIEGSSIYLKADQKATMLDLLYGVMLRSGNDAATSVAYFAGGKSVENFVEMMNNKAVEIGAYNTNFMNPHGLHNKDHYTTAYDLALITRYALKNNQFKEIASAKSYKNPANNFYFINKNKVVYEYKYGTGVKIGYTKTAGRCLVASAMKDDMEIIVVVLNDSNWFNDSYKIFDYAFDNYKKYNIVDKNQLMLLDDTNRPVLSNERFSYILTDKERENISIEIIQTAAHIANNIDKQIYGFYNVMLEGKIIYTGRLKYQE